MANQQQHINQWTHNRRFLSRIPPEYPDWIVTVTFYVALHAVDSLLDHDRVPRITSHDARNQVIYKTNRYRRIALAYRPLYEMARTVRYMAQPSDWIPAREITQNVFKRYLFPIEDSVLKLSRRQLDLPEITIMSDA